MADNQFAEQAEALFRGMNAFVSTKTVVGAPQQAGDAITIPLVDGDRCIQRQEEQ